MMPTGIPSVKCNTGHTTISFDYFMKCPLCNRIKRMEDQFELLVKANETIEVLRKELGTKKKEDGFALPFPTEFKPKL